MDDTYGIEELTEWYDENINQGFRSMYARLDEIISLLKNDKGKEMVENLSSRLQNFPNVPHSPDQVHRQRTQASLTPSIFEADSPATAIDGELSPLHPLDISHDGLDTGTSIKETREKPQSANYSHIPHSDKVYQIVQDTKDDGIPYSDHVNQTVQDTKDDIIDRPFIPERISAFEIEPPENVPFIVSEHGVHSLAHNQKISRVLKELCDNYDRVWKNERLIKVHGKLKDHAVAAILGISIDYYGLFLLFFILLSFIFFMTGN